MAGLVKLVMCVMVLLLVTGCQSRRGNAPIVRSVVLNDVDKVSQYLAEGGDADFTSHNGNPLLYIAAGSKGGVEVAALLIKAGADVNGQSKSGRTILQNASSWCDLAMVSLLLKSGADVNLVGKNGKSALDALCKSPADSREPVLQVLLSAGAGRG